MSTPPFGNMTGFFDSLSGFKSPERIEAEALAVAIVNSREWIEMDIELLESEIEEAYASIVEKRKQIDRLRVKLQEVARG